MVFHLMTQHFDQRCCNRRTPHCNGSVAVSNYETNEREKRSKNCHPYLNTYTYIHACSRIYTQCPFKYQYKGVYICMYMYVCMYMYIYTYMHTLVCSCIFADVYVYTHNCTHTYKHIHNV